MNYLHPRLKKGKNSSLFFECSLLLNRKSLPKWLYGLLLAAILLWITQLPALAQEETEALPCKEEQTFTSTAPYLVFEHYPRGHELSKGPVWGIVQDNQGFMWFSSFDGLNRYDGYDVKTFRNVPDDPNSLSDNQVRTLYLDSDGTLWVSTFNNGINKYLPDTEQFVRYQHDPNDPSSLSNDNTRALLQDREGILWVGTVGGLNQFDPISETFIHYHHDPSDPTSLSGDNIIALFEDHMGDLWVGTRTAGLNKFDRQTGKFIRFQHDPNDPTSLSHNRAALIFEDHTKNLWVGTWGGGLNRLNRENGQFKRFQHDPDDPGSISSDNVVSYYDDGMLWIGTLGGGLNLYDVDTESFSHYKHDPADGNSLTNNDIISIFVDREGTFWYGTRGSGLNLRPCKHFSNNSSISKDLNNIIDSLVWAIYEDQAGVLWVGTERGLYAYNPQTRQAVHYMNDPNDPRSLSNNSTYAIAEDVEGNIWIGTAQGLNILDRNTQTFARYLHDPEDPGSLSAHTVYSLLFDESGVLWIGTLNGGLNKFEPNIERFTRYLHDPEDAKSLDDNTIRSIYEDGAGTLWVGTTGGLNKFDRDMEVFNRYQYVPGDQGSLSDGTVYAITEDSAGTLWVGTSIGGLNKFESKTGKFQRYTVGDGLANNTVWAIMEGDNFTEEAVDSLWISTSAGLSRLYPQSETFHNIDFSDGILVDQYTFAKSKIDGDQMIFGGSIGVDVFNPDDIQNNLYVPPVVLTNFLLDNDPVEIDSGTVLARTISATDQLVLSYLHNVISFEFAALSFRNPQQNLYKYKLEGFDKDWREIGSDRRFATYTNLDPDEYVFRVLGSNNDGVWNEEGVSIAITITPPWWQTWWFLGIMTILVLGAVAGAFAWQNRNIRNQEQHLEKLLAERTTELSFIQSQMGILFENSPLGIGLATLEGDILSANKAMGDIFGYSEEEILQVNVLSYFKGSEQRAEIEKRLEIEKTIQVTPLQLQRKDGSPFYASLTESRITWGDQDVLMGIVHDITDQVLAEEALKSEAERAAVTEERSRLARELHDSATQSLYSALLFSETGKRLTESGNIEGASHFQNRVSDVIYQALKEMRLLVFELQLPLLDQEGLVGALKFRLETVERRSGVEAHLDVDEFPSPPSVISLNLYRIILEALNNALKHAQADEVRVKLTADGDLIIVEVIDNGIGFDIHTIEDQAGLGLKNMRARAERLGGDLALETSLGKGTSVRFTMAYPLELEETQTRLD